MQFIDQLLKDDYSDKHDLLADLYEANKRASTFLFNTMKKYDQGMNSVLFYLQDLQETGGKISVGVDTVANNVGIPRYEATRIMDELKDAGLFDGDEYGTYQSKGFGYLVLGAVETVKNVKKLESMGYQVFYNKHNMDDTDVTITTPKQKITA